MTNKPNLLIVMVDQMEAALLDARATVTLPALKRLAGSATHLTHAFTTAPICTPARASFQLGLPVHQHGVTGNNRPMPPTDTLADRLDQAGYQTSYVGKWHLDRDSPRGWQRWVDSKELQEADPGNAVMRGPDAPHQGIAPYSVREHIDGRIADHGLLELQRLQAGRHPYALMVSFVGPHAPYYLPAEWHGKFDPDSLPLPDTFDAPFEGKPRIQQTFRCRTWGAQWSTTKWREIRAAYYGYAAMLDHLIGQLIEAVDLQRTAILFLSDHGENNGHLRMIYKGPMMYDPLVRIPALLHAPGQTRARHDDRLVDLTDLTATVLNLAQASTEGMTGHNVLEAGWPGRDAVVSEFHEADWVSPPCRQRVAMLRDRQWKYVYNEHDRDELYDMREQPCEVINRIEVPQQQDRIARMRQALARQVPWVHA